MQPNHRPIGATYEALGIASILLTTSDGFFNIDQDLKGRWHIWASPALEPDCYDALARQLEPDL